MKTIFLFIVFLFCVAPPRPVIHKDADRITVKNGEKFTVEMPSDARFIIDTAKSKSSKRVKFVEVISKHKDEKKVRYTFRSLRIGNCELIFEGKKDYIVNLEIE